MRQNPIRSVLCPLPDSFEEDMERIKQERSKLVKEISDKCMTASDFFRACQDNKPDMEKKEKCEK
jgi:hypothetical protein